MINDADLDLGPLPQRIKEYCEQKEEGVGVSFYSDYSPKKKPELTCCCIRIKNDNYCATQLVRELKDNSIITEAEFYKLRGSQKSDYIYIGIIKYYWEWMQFHSK